MIDTNIIRDAVGAPSANLPNGLRTELLVFICHFALTTRNVRKIGVAEFESAIVSLFGFDRLPFFAHTFAHTPSSSPPLCCLQQAAPIITIISVTILLLQLCGILLAFTTTAHCYFLHFTDCIHQSLSILILPRLRNPSGKPL